MTATLTHTPAEQALIDALDGATGWRAQLREATQRDGLPTRRHELWKWSDLRRATADIGTALQDETRPLRGYSSAAEVEIKDGKLVGGAREIAAGIYVDEVAINPVVEAAGVAALASATASAAVRILFDGGPHVPVIVRHCGGVEPISSTQLITETSGEPYTLLEIFESGPQPCSRLIRTLLDSSQYGQVEHVRISDLSSDEVVVACAELKLPGANPGGAIPGFRQTTLSFGAKLVRHETHIQHAGEGAEVEMGGVYLLDAGRHADFTSTVHHTGPGGTTRQLVKGAVASGGQGVFQGKFIVDRAAQQTDARMTHRALMLGEKAEIDAKPELEIYADDVQCAHGNALGTLDETALFYMRQRGLPEAKARALLIESYLAEPLDRVQDEALRETLKASLRARLGALT